MKKLIPPSDSNFWSLADQALVSGSNFIVGVILARFLGPESFGAYVIAQVYLLYSNTFQSALVVSPMMTAVPLIAEVAALDKTLNGFFGYMVLVLLSTVVGVLVLAWVLGLWSDALALGVLCMPLAASMFGYHLQDWLRRALYVKIANRAVFLSDLFAYGGQLVGLVYLALQQTVHAEAALWVLAIAFSLSGLLTAVLHRLRPDFSAAVYVIRKHWRMSRDLFATWQLQWLGSQGVMLLGTGLVGQQAAGAIRAAQNLLGPVNVFFQWMDNVIPVRSTLRLRDGGRPALVAYLGKIAWVGIAVMSVIAAALALVSDWLIVFLYGEKYRPFAVLVVLQALYYLIAHGYRMMAYFQRTLGNTIRLAHASFWWALVAVIAALGTVNWLAERGIMLSLLAGELAAVLFLLRPRLEHLHDIDKERPEHIILRHGRRGCYLVLPCANKHVLRSALSMYFPSRLTGRLYRLFLRWTLPWGARLGWVETSRDLNTWWPHIEPVVQTIPRAYIAHREALIGGWGSRAKHTLKIMDASGDSLAYARVAEGLPAMNKLQREVDVLKAISTTDVGRHVPKVISCGALHGPDGFFIVESAGPETPAEYVLTEKHFDFLSSLVSDKKVAWRWVVDQIEASLTPLKKQGTLADVITFTIESLSASNIMAVPRCIEHGDFAPWNIRLSKGGDLFVLDWEQGNLNGLPWLDALHFCYQVEVLVRRRGPARVLVALRSVFDLPAARAYTQRVDLYAINRDALIMLYLLRRFMAVAVEGCPPDKLQQAKYCDILDKLASSAQTRPT